jgi:hypothetical protein
MATQTISAPHDDRVAQPPSAVEVSSVKKNLDDITAFLSRYLYCTEHQCTLLALWILHTHCFSAAEVTPYLSIQSDMEQSGKTRSLQLLSLLCPNPALTASFATSSLSSRIHYSEQRPTFLLDECHATIGSRNRSKNPILRAILTSGFHRGLGHTDRKGERIIFSPKAFAGIGPLPHALAERSIPIHLEQLNASVRLREFRSEQAQAEAQPLREWLAQWAEENLQKLKSVPTLELQEYPAGIPLTPRRKDTFKPLLQIAKVLGGEWPSRVTTALTEILKDHLNRERKHVLALLFELREAFSHYGQPDRIATASLLAWLHLNPDAPWNQEGPITASRLANMLRPFNIRPGLKSKDKKHEATHRGYALQSFLYTWNTLLPPEPLMNDNTSRREPMPDPPRSTAASEATVRAALETAASVEDRPEPASSAGAPSYPVLAGRESSSQEENACIDAGPNNLTTTREVSAGQSKSAPAGAPSYPVSVGRDSETEPSTSCPNLPRLVPNPQPIPFPSKAELEKQGYRFGPFSREHNPLDVEMIAHYAKRGYRPLQPHEVDYAEFRCNGVPFALAASVPHRQKPPEPPAPEKSPEELAQEELTAWLRKRQQSPPQCAERENIRLAPTKRR